jgi:hypothetical protein
MAVRRRSSTRANPRVDHGAVFADVRDVLGRVGADELARPAEAIGQIAGLDSAKSAELLLVLAELGSADGERGRRAVGAIGPDDRFAAYARGRPWTG